MTSQHTDQPQFQTCPRHPDQIAYTRCGRCGRPTCTQCQVPLEVGMMCVDCRDEHIRNAPKIKYAKTAPTMTYALIGINVVAYILQWLIPNYWMLRTFLFNPLYVQITGEWWRVLTSGFIHAQANPTHLLLNMFSLWIFGKAIEPMLGKWRYLLVYLLSILGGSAGVWFFGELMGGLNTNTVGASGGIFGLFGAFFVLTKLRGGESRPITILIVINFVYGFLFPGISWQAHLGGLVIGALVTWILQRVDGATRRQ
ncbi:rhomboid family intramembrane serine protease [Rothia aerolata]|uniref:Rhomboid family intramembrane serine protease n=2 Tax=Rothia aerolata TaxID=1812262 RepID=A0A917IYL0_9MICC|nr:rhomboid family intramembrane serine protease [Rothia aerolata]